MSDSEFVQPTESDFLLAFGAEHRPVPDEVACFVVGIDIDSQNELELSYDVVARSARVKWIRDSAVCVDLFREHVNRIAVENGSTIRISTRGPGLAGELTIDVYPVRIADTLLSV
ncbi:hypothetical protein [Nocardia brasiliensis]|uniref:hypothetical protein n=1 Tax=Nocardia brasiliensis TaxID=37326 RepID=UPI003D8BC889